MAVRSGQILHSANTFLIDRIQSAGVGSLNLPSEKIKELGNFQTVATIRDIPDLSFSLESLDVSTEIEAVLTGVDPTTVVAHQAIDFSNAMPLDIISPFKTAVGNYNIIRGIATPNLTLENVTYRFGVRANATQAYTLRGDSVYFVPGSPYVETFTLTSGTSQSYALAHTSIPFTEQGNTIYGYSVCVRNPSTHAYKRLFFGTDYTNTSTTVTLAANWVAAGYTKLNVVYGSTAAANYPQNVHQDVSVKPAAIRGKDIDLYLSDGAATPSLVRVAGVQSVEVTRRVTLENDEEFGNYHYVSSDYDVPEVSGSVVVRAFDAQTLFNLIAQVSNVQTSVTVGTQTSTPLPMEVRISDPDTGSVIKTLYVSDARFDPPAIQGRVNQKLDVTFPFSSDGGNLVVYSGTR